MIQQELKPRITRRSRGKGEAIQEDSEEESTPEEDSEEESTPEEIDLPSYITNLLNNLNNPDPNMIQYIRSIQNDDGSMERSRRRLNNLPIFFPNINSNETIDISEVTNNMINDLMNKIYHKKI